jgi:cytoskeletal protein CcmA (bactofilin family)
MWGNKNAEPEPRVVLTPTSATTRVTNPTDPISATLGQMNRSGETNRSAMGGNRLGAGLRIKGEISGHEDLQIDGNLEGLIQLDAAKLTVGPSARLKADIVANEIVVYGSVQGNLHARHRIEIKKEGSVIGDLTTARIMIEDGANFKGAIEIAELPVEKTGPDQKVGAPSVPLSEAAKVS